MGKGGSRRGYPDADEEFGVGGEGGGDGVGEGVAVGTGVEAHAAEVAREGLLRLEGFGPVGLGFAGAVEVVGADVEAFPVGGGAGDGGGEGECEGEEFHFEGRKVLGTVTTVLRILRYVEDKSR